MPDVFIVFLNEDDDDDDDDGGHKAGRGGEGRGRGGEGGGGVGFTVVLTTSLIVWLPQHGRHEHTICH